MDFNQADPFNQALLAQVHPTHWQNPSPVSRYDLVVIGGGTAGLVTAIGTAELNLGLKIALIEKSLLGGDCLNWGCVPSKTLIESARVAHSIRNAPQYGITAQAPSVSFAQVMQRVRQVRAEISPHDSVERCHQAGIDVFLGTATFLNPKQIQVAGQTLNFKRAVIATGARATIPTIPGLESGEFLTNETIFNLTELPQRLALIGGGPISCELGQALQRLGSQVTILQRNPHLLPRDDTDISTYLQSQLEKEGIEIKVQVQIKKIAASPTGKRIYYQTAGSDSIETLETDAIFVGVGRTANLESLGLANAGVNSQPGLGILVNDYLQTSQPHIFAAGDVCSPWKFTHAADAQARIVIQNALFSPWGLGRAKVSQLLIPRVTYTDPEIAVIGLSPEHAQAQNIPHHQINIPFADVDRAVTAGHTQGFLRLVLKPNSDHILGAIIVGNQAGELISSITQAMQTKQGLNALSKIIFPYPTQAEILKKAADQHYQTTLLQPFMRGLLKLVVGLTSR